MNIRDIARIAGVSTSTVSKIVNGKDSSISEETRKKVLTIVKEYHYKPYASASQRTRSYTIGVLLRSPISFDSTLDGIIQAAQNAGYATDAYNSYSDPERELKNIAAICGRNVDGVIWEQPRLCLAIPRKHPTADHRTQRRRPVTATAL